MKRLKMKKQKFESFLKGRGSRGAAFSELSGAISPSQGLRRRGRSGGGRLFLDKAKGVFSLPAQPAAGRAALAAALISSSALLAGCLVPNAGQQAGLSLSQDRDDNYYERRDRSNPNRRTTLDRSRNRYSGEDCGEEDNCEALCRKIYSRSTVRRDCLDLAADQVENLWHIYKTFERPGESALEEIDAEDFRVFVNLDSAQRLEKLLRDLRASEGKRVLAWMMGSGDIAEVFKSADDDFKLLEDLLKSVEGGNDKYQEAMKKTISDGDSLMELALEEQGEVLEWLHDFIEDKVERASAWNDHEELGILGDWYCKILTSRDEDAWSGLVDYERFQDVANVILEEYTTVPNTARNTGQDLSWRTDDLVDEGVTDLSDERDLHDLCAYIISEDYINVGESCKSGKKCLVKAP